MLSWSLVVCTLNRREILEQSLRTAINQTRLPKQIIVVDASEDWELTRNSILGSLAPNSESIEWIYVGSDQKSSTRQRNIGIGFCNSDIAFLLDDDSFMYPDCAEAVMHVYELDQSCRVGGVTTLLADMLPMDTSLERVPNEKPVESPAGNFLLKRFHKLWNQEELFLPYDGQYYLHNAQELNGQASIFSVVLFHGCRMTFRTSVIRELGGFDEVLIRSAIAEDIDMSYRVSRKYALVAAVEAKIFHLQTEISRVSRYTNAKLGILNAVALFLLNTKRHSGTNLLIYGFAIKRLLLESIRDCAKFKRGFPHVRGVLDAVLSLHKLVQMDKEHLRSWYPSFQTDIFERKQAARRL